MTHDIIIEIINLLVGPTNPIGESNEDEKRLSNLITQQAVTITLIRSIVNSSFYKYNKAASMKAIGKSADQFIENLRKTLGE